MWRKPKKGQSRVENDPYHVGEKMLADSTPGRWSEIAQYLANNEQMNTGDTLKEKVGLGRVPDNSSKERTRAAARAAARVEAAAKAAKESRIRENEIKKEEARTYEKQTRKVKAGKELAGAMTLLIEASEDESWLSESEKGMRRRERERLMTKLKDAITKANAAGVPTAQLDAARILAKETKEAAAVEAKAEAAEKEAKAVAEQWGIQARAAEKRAVEKQATKKFNKLQEEAKAEGRYLCQIIFNLPFRDGAHETPQKNYLMITKDCRSSSTGGSFVMSRKPARAIAARGVQATLGGRTRSKKRSGRKTRRNINKFKRNVKGGANRHEEIVTFGGLQCKISKIWEDGNYGLWHIQDCQNTAAPPGLSEADIIRQVEENQRNISAVESQGKHGTMLPLNPEKPQRTRARQGSTSMIQPADKPKKVFETTDSTAEEKKLLGGSNLTPSSERDEFIKKLKEISQSDVNLKEWVEKIDFDKAKNEPIYKCIGFFDTNEIFKSRCKPIE